MMTNASSLEDQVSNMAKVLEHLMKTIEDRDAHIAFLMNKLENVEEAVKPTMLPLASVSAGKLQLLQGYVHL